MKFSFRHFAMAFGLMGISLVAHAQAEHEEPCLCGISPAEEGVCLDDCDEAEAGFEETSALDDAAEEENEELCLYGVAAPGECEDESR